MADQELKLVITVDKDGALSGIKQVQDAEKGLQTETKAVGLRFTELNQITELARKGFEALASAARLAIDAVDQGSKINNVSEAFDRLATSAGVVSDKFLADLNRATGDTIDNFTLMKQANEALQKGLTPDQFYKIIAAARDLADTMGTDLLSEIQQISQAFQTGNTKILQNRLGIIDLKDAEDALAESLGIKREQLTKEQQIMSARTAILKAMNDEAKRGLEIENDSGAVIQQIAKYITDQYNTIKTSLASNKEFNNEMQRLRDILKTINWSEATSQIVNFAVNAAKGLNFLIESIVNFNQNLKALKEIFRQSPFFDKDPIDTVSAAAKKLNEQFRALTFTGTVTAEGARKLGKVLTSLENEINDVQSATLEMAEAQGETLSYITIRQFEEQQKALTELKEIYLSYVEELEKPIVTELIVTGGGGDTVSKAGFFQSLFGASDEAWAAQMKQLGEDLENVLAEAIGTGLRLAFDGGNSEDWKQLTKQTGAGIGEALGKATGTGPIGAAIGEFIGEKAGKAIFDGFNHVFGGGRSDETRARKKLQAFFDQALADRELEIIVDGRLKELFKFDRLKGSFPQNFRELFSNLDDTAENAFKGIGTALGNALKIDAKDWDNLNFLLAENLGNLNNLQLVMKMTGQSAEEMAANIVDAFLKSNISADEAMAALDGVRKAFEEGIPDGVGMTAEAFENLAISGGKGYAAIDAVKDIFIEAGEKGITTFDQLRKDLLASGKTIEQVDAFFASLAQRGITSFEQILQGSDEFLIGIIANLDDTGFKFAEIVETIDDLGQKLDDLERGRDIDIRLNVTTNATASAQALIDAGALPGVA